MFTLHDLVGIHLLVRYRWVPRDGIILLLLEAVDSGGSPLATPTERGIYCCDAGSGERRETWIDGEGDTATGRG
jgi:hypothetical protein